MHLLKWKIWYITTMHTKVLSTILIKYVCQGHILITKSLKCILMYLKFVILTNIVSNIYWTFNKFLPNTIICFTRYWLLQSYLLPIITRKDHSNLVYLYYGSYLSTIALVIDFRWCLLARLRITLRNEWLRNGHIWMTRK